MGNYQIISKGNYQYPQQNNYVSLKQYMFVREKGHTNLLLRFFNSSAEVITGISFSLSQLDTRGLEIVKDDYFFDNLTEKPNATFSLNKKIRLDDRCVDFRIKILSTDFGNYSYATSTVGKPILTYKKSRSSQNVDVDKITQRMGGRKHDIRVRSAKVGPALCIVMVLLFLAMFAANWFNLKYFMDTEPGFTLSDVEYTFLSDNRVDGPVSITGYKGNARDVVIPERIDGLKVVEIAPNAFSNQQKMETLTIEGAVEIGDTAFYNCTKLKTISIDNVTRVGSSAFGNCASLESVTAYNLSYVGDYAFAFCNSLNNINIVNGTKALLLGKGPFSSCPSLETVVIDQYMDESYLDNYIIDSENSVKNLTLYNFSSNMYSSGLDGRQLTSVVGYGNSWALENLTIRNLDFISNYFCSSMTGLTSVTIENLTNPSIGNNAFEYCNSLTTVSLPDSVREIGNSAFRNTAIKQYNGNALTSIGGYAFADCSKLETFLLNQNTVLEYIQPSTFQNCTSLKSIYIPNSVDYIYDRAFSGCTSLSSVEFQSGSSLQTISYGCFETCTSLQTISLPSAVTDIGSDAFKGCNSLSGINLPVALTSLGSGVFENCVRLTSITIPSGITSVPSASFRGCTNLSTVSLPSNVTAIFHNAFENCTGITQFAFPTSLNHIYDYAFSGTGLTNLTLGTGVNYIGSGAFGNCNSLTAVSLPFVGEGAYSNQYFGYIFGVDNRYTSTAVLPQSLKTVVITNASSIAERAFYGCTGLNSITINNGVSFIGEYAFGRSGIEHLVIPNTVTSMGAGILQANISIKTLTTPFVGGNEYNNNFFGYFFGAIDKYSNGNVVPSSLEEVTITNTYSIGESAFYGCNYIKQVNLPGMLTTIGDSAFSGCSSLDSIVIPNSVATVGRSAFYNCALTEITLPFIGNTASNDTYLGYIFGGYDKYQNYMVVPATLTKVIFNSSTPIGAGAFYNCINLKEVVLHNNLSSIQGEAFYNCPSLTSITLPDGVTSIGENAFCMCGLTSIVLPDNLESLSASVFNNNGSLTSVTLPNGLESIGDYAFNYCSALADIDLPDGLQSIGSYAFAGCAFTSFSIPSTVTSLGSAMLSNCNSLTEIDIPFTGDGTATNTSVGHIFGGYEYAPQSLTKITVSTATSIGNYAFNHFTNLTEVVLPSDVVSLGAYAFADCQKLTSIDLPDSILSFGDYVFSGSGLTSIVLPPEVSFVPNNAFYECAALSEVTFNDVLTNISAHAFDTCPLLTEVNLPDGLESIGDYAFANNVFTSFTVPDSVSSIGICAFYECNNLEEITVPFAGESRNGGNAHLGHIFGRGDRYSANQLPRSLKKVTITDAQTIYGYAFNNCSYLNEVVLNEGVTSITDSAFYNCLSLKKFIIPSTIVSIESNAFFSCYKLAEVYNLSPLTVSAGGLDNGYVGHYALKVYNSLSEDRIPNVSIDGFEFLQSSDGVWHLVNYDLTQSVISFPANFTYGGYAVTSYELYDYLCYDNDIVTEISIPMAVSSIGQYAFTDCEKLNSVSISANCPITEIGDRLFENCVSLTEIAFPRSVQTIGYGAFSNCQVLRTVELPSSLTTIHNDAFSLCYKLYEIYNFSGLSITIGDTGYGRVAEYAIAIHTTYSDTPVIDVTVDNLEYVNYKNVWLLVGHSFMDFPSTLVLDSFTYNGRRINSFSIARDVFMNNQYLVDLTIGSAVTDIGVQAFYGCPQLNTVTFTDDCQVTALKENIFAYCHNLKDVTLNNSITAIGDSVFISNTALSNVLLSNKLLSIGNGAFYECYSLSKITLPDGLLTIGDSVFYGNSKLKEIDIPSSVIEIGYSAFTGCSALQRVDMQANLTQIKRNTFSYCYKLMYITVSQNVADIENNAFYNCYSLIDVYNLSALPIQAGSSSYGYVGYYATRVTNAVPATPMKQVIVNDRYYFANVGTQWYLYYADIGDVVGMITLPGKIVSNGQTISSYKIRKNAFRNLSYNHTSILIPKNVTGMDSRSFMNAGYIKTVYYGGNEDEWNTMTDYSLSYDLISATKLYYSECIHEDGLWRYDDAHNVTIEYSELEWHVTTPATCTDDGERQAECPVCGTIFTETIESTGHTCDVSGYCVDCGAQKAHVTSNTIETLTCISNDTRYPFEINEVGEITSTNHEDNSLSVFTITADGYTEVECSFRTYSELNGDKLLVKLNGEIVFTLSGSHSQSNEKFILQDGDTLTFTYKKDASNSVSSDMAVIYDMYII